MYWLPNSVLSIIQTQVLKKESIRNFFKIPKMPEQTVQSAMNNPMAKISEVKKCLM